MKKNYQTFSGIISGPYDIIQNVLDRNFYIVAVSIIAYPNIASTPFIVRLNEGGVDELGKRTKLFGNQVKDAVSTIYFNSVTTPIEIQKGQKISIDSQDDPPFTFSPIANAQYWITGYWE